MVRRKGELSSKGIDRGHQVTLPANQCSGRNYTIKHEFCRGLSLCPRGHSFRRDDRDYVVFCFADAAHADHFGASFGGEPSIRACAQSRAAADQSRLRLARAAPSVRY